MADSSELSVSMPARLEYSTTSRFFDALAAAPHEFVGFRRSPSYRSAFARSLAAPEACSRDLESHCYQAWPDEEIPVDFHTWFPIARGD